MKIPSNLFSQIVENSVEGIWLVDINFRTSYVNKILADMLGYDQQEVVDKKFQDMMSPEDWEDLSKKLASRAEGVSEHHITRFLKKDGSPLWTRCGCHPLYNDNGAYVGAVGLISDITEQRKDEMILQAQRNVFAKLVNGASLEEGLTELLRPIERLVSNVYPSILLLDDEGRLWEGASINIPENYHQGVNGTHIGPHVGSCGTSAFLKTMIITEDIQSDPRWVDYKEIAERNGLRSCWSCPIMANNGKVLGTFAMYFAAPRKPSDFEIQIVKDITTAATLCIEYIRLIQSEKKHNQRMNLLAETRRVLSTSMEYEDVMKEVPKLIIDNHMGAWCFICFRSENGVFKTLSIASIPEIKIDEGLFEFELSAKLPLARSIRENKPIVESFDEAHLIQRLKNYDGDEKYRKLIEKFVELKLRSYIAIPLEVRGEVIGGFLLAGTDPEKNYNQDDLEFMCEIGRSCAVAIDNALLFRATKKAVKAREDFISVASHELRTPLTSLKMRIDLLTMFIEKKTLPDSVNQILWPVLSELKPDVMKFTRLIETLLDFSKFGGEKLHLQIENCDLSKVISEEVKRQRHEFTAHNTELVANVQQGIVGECDQLRVQQVVTNLLTNAMKFGNQKPVYLDVSMDGKNIFIQVRDQGIGISKEDIERIFLPFERAVSEKHFGGLGLGLFITKQIVHRHGGAIAVESIPGKGTTFNVKFPKKASK